MDSKSQWYCKPLYKQRIMPGVLLIHIGLNEIQFETNGLEMIVENKLRSFLNLHEWMKAAELSKTLINVLIYDEREVSSVSK